MKISKYAAATVFCLIACTVEAKDIFGVTESGKPIVLREDGTWVFADKLKESDYSFRKVRWGMSRAQVEAAEKGEPHRSQKYIGYEVKVAGKKAYVIYIFASDKLVRAKYVFGEDFVNQNRHIGSYNAIDGILIEKYGKPLKKESTWTDSLYKSDPSDYGRAISIGHLVYESTWQEGDTEISHVLMGAKFKVVHQVEYFSKSLRGLEEKANKLENESVF